MQRGRLTDWNDDRGFGYITPLDGGATVFAHISEFPDDQRRPIVTDLVDYATDLDDRGRLRARGVRFLAPTRTRIGRAASSQQSYRVPAVAISCAFLTLIVAMAAFGSVAWALPVVYVVLSAITFFAYGLDKRAAEKRRWRTAESTLHLLAVLGGWPGALVAQRTFHHKTVKQPFQTIFWITVVVNLAFVTWIVASTQLSPVVG